MATIVLHQIKATPIKYPNIDKVSDQLTWGHFKDGIMVAEYWTELPPKAVLENKLHRSLLEAKERIARKKLK